MSNLTISNSEVSEIYLKLLLSLFYYWINTDLVLIVTSAILFLSDDFFVHIESYKYMSIIFLLKREKLHISLSLYGAGIFKKFNNLQYSYINIKKNISEMMSS